MLMKKIEKSLKVENQKCLIDDYPTLHQLQICHVRLIHTYSGLISMATSVNRGAK